MVKVFAVPSHQQKDRTSGVDFARVIQPMKHLNGYKDFKIDIFDIHGKDNPNWIQVAEEYDMVFLNYTVLDYAFAAMGAMLRGKGRKIVMDIDDATWFIRPDNPTYNDFHDNNGKYIHDLTCMLDEVDHVITTSPYLKNVVVDKTYKRHEQVTVIPNYIDLSLYNKTFKVNDTHMVTIMHCGSTTHFADLLQKPFVEGLTRVMEEIPNVKFVTVGSNISEFKYKFGQRYEITFGDRDIYEWIKKFPTFMEQADIVIAPLETDKYNRSKSFIKYLEYSSTKRPGVYQDIDQYRNIVNHGVNGYLAQSSEDWYDYLKALILDVKLRQNIGNQAYKTIKDFQIKDHVSEYADVFAKVLDYK